LIAFQHGIDRFQNAYTEVAMAFVFVIKQSFLTIKKSRIGSHDPSAIGVL
jgi:hypothetical protein